MANEAGIGNMSQWNGDKRLSNYLILVKTASTSARVPSLEKEERE